MWNVLFWILVVVWGTQTLVLLLLIAIHFYKEQKNQRIGGGPPAESKTVRVVEVLSGDTLAVEVDGKHQIIRLSGINCSEGPHQIAEDARELMTELCLDQDVQYVEVGELGEQKLAYIHTHDGSCVQHLLLRKGLARHALDYCDASFQSIENDAREKGIGLWSQPHFRKELLDPDVESGPSTDSSDKSDS